MMLGHSDACRKAEAGAGDKLVLGWIDDPENFCAK